MTWQFDGCISQDAFVHAYSKEQVRRPPHVGAIGLALEPLAWHLSGCISQDTFVHAYFKEQVFFVFITRAQLGTVGGLELLTAVLCEGYEALPHNLSS